MVARVSMASWCHWVPTTLSSVSVGSQAGTSNVARSVVVSTMGPVLLFAASPASTSAARTISRHVLFPVYGLPHASGHDGLLAALENAVGDAVARAGGIRDGGVVRGPAKGQG